jgi:hypothetical protein
MMHPFRISLLFLVLLSLSCTKDKLTTPASFTSFIPLSIGMYADYEIERTLFSITSPPRRLHYTMRQVITDTIRNISNQLIYRIDYYSLNAKLNWESDSSSVIWQAEDKVIGMENGVIILKILYPLSNGSDWNGNWFNHTAGNTFQAVDLGKTYSSKSGYFPYTVKIIRQDDSTLLSGNKYIEIFALNVGLIRSEKYNLNYCNTPDCLGKGLINSGWTEIRTIKNYGKL